LPEQEQFKRHIAFKLRIGDLLIGKPIFDEERFSFLELGNKKIMRVNVMGNVVEKYDSERETKFSTITLDDGSGQIKLKLFGEDTEKFGDISQGQTILVIGVLRHWNNELYISPEIVREQDPKYLLVRKMETEKDKSKNYETIAKEQVVAIKDRILGAIKNSEDEGGIETDKLIMNLNNISPVIINQEIQKLLEEGIVFEPRPGKVRYLG
jgi:RPA family protein